MMMSDVNVFVLRKVTKRPKFQTFLSGLLNPGIGELKYLYSLS